MPDALIVCVFLAVAGIAFLFSPMPMPIRLLLAVSFFYISAIYGLANTILVDVDDRMTMMRWGMIVLSSVIVICVSTWRIAGDKIWRRR